MFLRVLAVLVTALISLASAQSSTTPSSTQSSSATGTSTYSATGQMHMQCWSPVGDIIECRFYPLNHSVARAAFQQPCIPYEDTGAARVGFWSGFEPVSLVLSNPPIFRLLINDTEPAFFYCSAPDACFQGMIGVINPNSTFNYTAQIPWALNATEEFSPLEYFPVEALPTRTTTALTVAVTSSTGTPTPATTSAAAAHHSSSLSGGAIAGIVIGGAIVVILAGALIYMCERQKSLAEILRHSQAPSSHPGHQSYQAGPGGVSEANYPNMTKGGHASMMSGQYSDQGYHGPATETESYRSMSPPLGDERTAMMSMLHQSSQQAIHSRNGQPSPGSPGSAPFPSPGYSMNGTGQSHEMDQNRGGLTPPHPENPAPLDVGPHELAGPSPDANSPRPFSFTDSETGYRPDNKIDLMMR